MQFTAKTKDMSRALAVATKAVMSGSTIPMLTNVLLVADQDGHIKVRGTDLEITIQEAFSADVLQPGEATVPARLFASYVANLPEGDVEINASANALHVKAKRSKSDFNALPANEFPPLPHEQANELFVVDAQDLRKLVNGTIFSASSEPARGAILMGALIEIVGEKITVVATDGYRLARCEAAVQNASNTRVSYIVPPRALAEALRSIGDSTAFTLTSIGKGRNQLSIKSDDSLFIMVRLIDGQYPNYKQIIPENHPTHVTVETRAILDALKRADLMCADRINAIKMSISKEHNALTLTVNSDTTGNALEEVEISEMIGEDISVSFNARFMLDILNHIDAQHTTFEFDQPLKPVLIHPAAEAPGQLYVLMPLRN